jgi:hypothetical protein
LSRLRRRGIALPVMLIILVVMMVTSIYMLRSTHSTALTTGNLAYDATLSRAADYGLHAGFQWLHATASGNKAALNASDATHGYEARFDTTLDTRSSAFWTNAITVTDPDNHQIDYVVHRLCLIEGAYDGQGNYCMVTAANTSPLGNTVALGDSLASDAAQFAGSPQVHYVITARIHGARGASVTNQLIVLIGA